MRFFWTLVLLLPIATILNAAESPNVLIVITDDQGYGDLGFHGNPVLKSPNIDRFAKKSLRMTNFYVSPVCSPTRSSLLTGRYNYRTGVVDTYIGRSMMHTDETTLAERLRSAGFRTGLFGKWHLGDNFPMRPQDQGFEEVLMHRGGGIAQPSDPPNGSSYQDPTLFHNGTQKKYSGYCTDVFTDAAIEFMSRKSDKPFFAYLAYNCPHAPYQVRDEDYRPYRDVDLSPNAFPKIGQPWSGSKPNTDEIAKAYGMIANIDANFERLLKACGENTIVIFMTDNGPGGVRWNGGLRNRKGTVYEGGIRIPFFVHHPKLPHDRDQAYPAAHIDVTPTIIEACGLSMPKTDGISLWGLWTQKKELPDRNLFIQWHRGDVPEKGRAFAMRGPRYKLVQSNGVDGKTMKPNYELFDIKNDPFEQTNLAEKMPEQVKKMNCDYEAWFEDVNSTRNFAPPRIVVGDDRENPSNLTRQDWRGPKAGWAKTDEGYWEIAIAQNGKYDISCDFDTSKAARQIVISIGGQTKTLELNANQQQITFKDLELNRGDSRLEVWINEGTSRSGVIRAMVKRVERR